MRLWVTTCEIRNSKKGIGPAHRTYIYFRFSSTTTKLLKLKSRALPSSFGICLFVFLVSSVMQFRISLSLSDPWNILMQQLTLASPCVEFTVKTIHVLFFISIKWIFTIPNKINNSLIDLRQVFPLIVSILPSKFAASEWEMNKNENNTKIELSFQTKFAFIQSTKHDICKCSCASKEKMSNEWVYL